MKAAEFNGLQRSVNGHHIRNNFGTSQVQSRMVRADFSQVCLGTCNWTRSSHDCDLAGRAGQERQSLTSRPSSPSYHNSTRDCEGSVSTVCSGGLSQTALDQRRMRVAGEVLEAFAGEVLEAFGKMCRDHSNAMSIYMDISAKGNTSLVNQPTIPQVLGKITNV